MQITDTLLMIKPVAFGFNEETAENNYFQKKSTGTDIQSQALIEFENFVEKLRENGINVHVIEDTLTPHTPDSIYPNNWISTQRDGTIILYPMFAENRRLERRDDIINQLNEQFVVTEIHDLSNSEHQHRFLEGTGGIILDRDNRIAYGSVSIRLEKDLFLDYCNTFNYKPIVFHSYQKVNDERLLIYHTNVMMCVATEFAVICLASIDDEEERKLVVDSLRNSRKEIIAISEKQMHQFAGNMLQVKNTDGKSFLVMSKAAYNSLTSEQLDAIGKYTEIIYADLSTIEENGGGSARCMLAEVFLQHK